MASGHSASTPHVPQLSRRRFVCVLIGLMLAVSVSSLSETIASTALPTIVGDLGGVELMQWISTAYILTSTIVMPFYGKASDTFGRKHLMMGALILYALGKAVCGVATNMEVLICGRCISGLGGGGMSILAYAVLSDLVPPRKLGVYMGAAGAVFTTCNVLGPVFGGWFVEVPGWRWIFWFTIPFAGVALAALAAFLPKEMKRKQRACIDYVGMALVALAVTSLVLLTAWGGITFPWNSWEIISLGTVFALSTAGFIFAEKRAKEPIMPLSLFANRNFVLCCITSLLIDVAFMGTVTYLPTYFQIVDTMSPEAAGLMGVPLSIGIFLTSTLSGFLAAKTGRYKWMLVASSAIAAAGFALMATMQVHQPLWLPIVFQFILGFGIGFGMQILLLVVQNEFPHSMVGAATAAYNFFSQIGSVLGASFIGTLFTSRLSADLARMLPATDNISVSRITPQLVDKLPDSVQTVIAQGYSDALIPLFLWFAPLCAFTVILMLLVRSHPLATTIDHGGAK